MKKALLLTSMFIAITTISFAQKESVKEVALEKHQKALKVKNQKLEELQILLAKQSIQIVLAEEKISMEKLGLKKAVRDKLVDQKYYKKHSEKISKAEIALDKFKMLVASAKNLK